MLLAACVSTESDRTDRPSVLCVAKDGPTPADAVVLVKARLGDQGFTYCSGVLVASDIVLTGLGCVVALNDPDALDPRPTTAEENFISINLIDLDYDSLCERDRGWKWIEDGSFAAELGEPLQPDAIGVSVRGALDDTFQVKSIFTSRGQSHCGDDLAALVLEAPTNVSPAAVRLEDVSHVGDAVTLLGFCVTQEGPLATSTLDSQVEGVTFEEGDVTAPPRSLLLSHVLSVFASGGAVFSPETGALIGVITSGEATGCGEAGPEGKTVAVRLAPFRRMLIDAARAAGQPLHTERGAASSAGEPMPACPDL